MQDNGIKQRKNIEDYLVGLVGGTEGARYYTSISVEREKMIEYFQSFKGYGTSTKIVKGDIAEFFHCGTFNINAAQKGSLHRVFVDRSHDLGSVDISSNFGKKYGLKYMKTAEISAKHQAMSVLDGVYKNNPNISGEKVQEVLLKNGYGDANLFDALYEGQVRIIPTEQLEIARDYLNRKILEESAKRPEQVARYKETLEMLDDRIRDDNGITSETLSVNQAEELAGLAKEGNITASVLGLEEVDLLKLEYVAQNAMNAGIQMAAIAAGIDLVLNLYEKYKKENKFVWDYSVEDWTEIFKSVGEKSFRAGVTASTLFFAGSYCSSAVPAVSALLMATFGIATLIPDYINGKITQNEFIIETEMVCMDAAIILLGTVIGQLVIPTPALGALLGAIAGSIAIAIIEHFWGDELREVLRVFNEHVKSLLEHIKEFFVKLWQRICTFFKKIKGKIIECMLDDDYNRSLHSKYTREKDCAKQKRQEVSVNYSRQRKENIYE